MDLTKTNPKGAYEERISHLGLEVSATVWKDKKVFTLLSTYIRLQSVDNICRSTRLTD